MKKTIATLIGVIMPIAMSNAATNPLLNNWWKGPHGGVPEFDKVKVADFKPAIQEAMNQMRTEIKAIAENSAAPTFENTIVAMEKCGRTLDRVLGYYSTWSGSMSSPDFQAVEKDIAPKVAGFQDEIIQNQKLFKRIETVYNSPDKIKLNPEQQRLSWYQWNKFILQGAKLDDKNKATIAELNQKLASLTTQFSQNQLADEENEFLVIDKKEDLKGLPQSVVEAAAGEATAKKLKDKWVMTNTRSSVEPFLMYSSNRPLREKAFKMWTSRGDNANSHNNNKIVTEILKLRAERAKILGFQTFAHWRLADSMAKDPQIAMDLMMKVWTPAVAQAKKEVAEMQALVDKENGGFKIAPWDYRYYAEKVRQAKYDLDFNAVKPYLQLDNIQKGLFLSAGKLFNFKFTKLSGIPTFHKDQSVYQVTKDGKQVGLWYFDPYARAGKSSGAWMSAYREQNKVDELPITTIVSNNSNFIKTKPGQPVLISWDDAITMFHEFGHALHGLSSNVTYPSISGTNTARDFVEFPSQVYENFLETPEVLALLTNQEGKALPKELIAKIEKARTFNEGFSTVEFLASAIVDMKLHLAGDKTIDPAKFEKETLKEIGMPSEIVMRHRIPAFGHLFSGDSYAAGYYSYLWSQVLDHDAYEAFTEAGNPYDKNVAQKLNDYVFSIGNTMDPAEAYRKFRGRDPSVNALLRARGFPVPNDSTTK